MSEYWKSTPSYWCKFCSTYVRDTGLERKNHEASGKHQNNIQRSLRELQKNKDREDRETQRAKSEVARLNGLVDTKGSSGSVEKSGILGLQAGQSAASGSRILNAAAQRKAHAEQLAALGVELPEELKKEITGVGEWQVVSEHVVVKDVRPEGVQTNRLDLERNSSQNDIEGPPCRETHKRKTLAAEDNDEDEEAAPKREPWGSNFKSYPGPHNDKTSEDLDALLSGVMGRPKVEVKKEESEEKPAVKREELSDENPLAAYPDINVPTAPSEQMEVESTLPTVVFKKRKVKK